MKMLFLLASLVAGAVIGWLSVLAGIWFVMPIFLICAGIVSISLGSEFRWRVVAFGLGMCVAFGLEANDFVRGINETQRQMDVRSQQKFPTPTPMGGQGAISPQTSAPVPPA